MNKLLFITNTANKIGSFSIASITAAHDANLEFQMAAYWNLTRENMNELQNDFDVKLHHIDLVRSPYSFRNYKALKQLVKIIRDEKIDCIHCNTPVGGILGRFAGRKCKVKKVIYQAHGFHFYKGAPKKNWLLYYPIEKWLAHYTDAIITINQEDYELAKSKLKLRNAGKVYYVPGVGIDTSQYNIKAKSRDDKRIELNIPLNAFVIISVGELNSNKNNSVIISALKQLKRNDIHYVMCGVGELETELRRQADNAGLHDNVHFLGYRNDVKELYEIADCFVMPSLREGLSRSIMEAMASGLPCVVSRIRGNVDLVDEGKGGFLCHPKCTEEFATAIENIAANIVMRNSMGEYNKGKIKAFDVLDVVEKLKSIYAEIREKK